jgi:hypothetical protein
MTAIVKHFICDVGQIRRTIGHVGTVARIGLKKLIPKDHALLVCHIVEVKAGAPTYPIPNKIQVRQRMHVKLCIEPLPWAPFHRFVETPVAAANHDSYAIDRDREILRAGTLKDVRYQ